jgi:hypothetical protein
MWLGERDLSDYRDKKLRKFFDLVIAYGWHKCAKRGAFWIGDIQDLPHDDNIYRVSVDQDTGYVTVACIGLESVDAIVDGNYSGINELPDWMQEKITLLSMLSPVPPTEPVEGVGRRINADIYWVFR